MLIPKISPLQFDLVQAYGDGDTIELQGIFLGIHLFMKMQNETNQFV